MNQRQIRGQVAYAAGVSAENRIAQDYERRGFTLARRRWRGQAGEIDLIAQRGDELIFVEVKKSGTIARAAQSLSRRQMERIYNSAAQYLGTQPLGQMTPSRFDVALVDAQGQFEIIENAFGAF